MFGAIASLFDGTNIMEYNSSAVLNELRGDFNGTHLALVPDVEAVADDMGPGDEALAELKQRLMRAPTGMVWYVARSFEHPGGWSIHAAVALRTAEDICIYDMDGAEGDDWTDGPASTRMDYDFRDFFCDCTKQEGGPILQFDSKHHFCLFLPLGTLDPSTVREKAYQVKREPSLQHYNYLKCNCQTFAARLIAELFNGVPERYSLVMSKVMPSAHSSLVDAGVAADWITTGMLAGAFLTPLGLLALGGLPMAAGAAAGGGAIAKGVADGYNTDALPKHLGRIIRTNDPGFPVLTLQCD